MLILEIIALVLLCLVLLCACGVVVNACFGSGFTFEGMFWWMFFGRDCLGVLLHGIGWCIITIAELCGPDS